MKLGFPRFGYLATCLLIGFTFLGATTGVALGEAKVEVQGTDVQVKRATGNTAISIGSGNSAGNSTGLVDTDVEMEGIAVINDDVFIDGEKLPRGKTRHTSKKSGKSYRIQWGKNGNISVEQD